MEGEYGGMPIRLDMMRVRLAKEVKIKDRRIEELVRKLELNHMIIIYMTGERGTAGRHGRDMERAGGDGCDKAKNGEREYLEEGEG